MFYRPGPVEVAKEHPLPYRDVVNIIHLLLGDPMP